MKWVLTASSLVIMITPGVDICAILLARWVNSLVVLSLSHRKFFQEKFRPCL